MSTRCFVRISLLVGNFPPLKLHEWREMEIQMLSRKIIYQPLAAYARLHSLLHAANIHNTTNNILTAFVLFGCLHRNRSARLHSGATSALSYGTAAVYAIHKTIPAVGLCSQ